MDGTHSSRQAIREYADDGVVHCHSLVDADKLQVSLKERLAECGLELHPTKTRIIYCEDDDRWGDYPETKFDFLGYTFRPRRSKSKYGKFFINFTPAVSNKAIKAMQPIIYDWRIHEAALKPGGLIQVVQSNNQGMDQLLRPLLQVGIILCTQAHGQSVNSLGATKV